MLSYSHGMRYRLNDLLDPDSWYYASFYHAAGFGFWRNWWRWQQYKHWDLRKIADGVDDRSFPIPDHTDEWPMETGGLPLDPGLSRSHWLRHRLMGDKKKCYWCAEDGSWYAAGGDGTNIRTPSRLKDSSWTTRTRQMTVREAHYSFIYEEPA
jgi:hypothetical protein